MSIPYTFEVVSVNPEARCMEIIYKADGHQTMHISARLPFADESFETIVEMFAPVAYWEEQRKSVIVPAVGISGTVTPPIPESDGLSDLDRAKRTKREEIANWRYRAESRGILFNGTVIQTDPESQARLASVHWSIDQGFITSVDWKAADGSFITLTATEFVQLVSAVTAQTQAVFSREKSLFAEVDAAVTVDEVKSIRTGAVIPATSANIPASTL